MKVEKIYVSQIKSFMMKIFYSYEIKREICGYNGMRHFYWSTAPATPGLLITKQADNRDLWILFHNYFH